MSVPQRPRGPFDRDAGPALPRAGVVALGVMLLALHGLIVDIVPAPFLVGAVPFWTCVAFGAVATFWLFQHAARNGRIEAMRRKAGWAGLWPLAILGPPMIGFLAWSAATRSLPWFWTTVFGAEHEQAATMVLQHTRGRGGGQCRDRLYGGPLGEVAFVCSGPAFRDSPAGPVRVVLRGKASSLGLIVQDVRRADAGAAREGAGE